MLLNVMIVKIGRTYPISAGSMGAMSMLGPLAALGLHVLVVAVPGGVPRVRDVQGVVAVAAAAADVEGVDVVDSMILSVFGESIQLCVFPTICGSRPSTVLGDAVLPGVLDNHEYEICARPCPEIATAND